MSTINWAKAASGNWIVSTYWAGGVVPGPDDTAVISAVGKAYTVLINQAVTVGGVVLDQGKATLEVSGSLTSASITLEAGTFLLEGGTVAGTVTEAAGVLEIARNDSDTLSNVTWQGPLDPDYLPPRNNRNHFGTLTISGGLTLTGAGGIGPGSATFSGPIIFSDMASLNDAAITAGTLQIENSPSLTLGAGMNLDCTTLTLSSDTLTNYGSLVATESSGGTVVNYGTLAASNISFLDVINNGLLEVAPGSNELQPGGLTNGGTILIGSGQLIEYDITYPPTTTGTGVTMIDGGTVGYYFGEYDPIPTTAQLIDLYSSENIVEAGAYGISFSEINNAGATLDIGANSILGTLAAYNVPSESNGGPVIEGGTVVISGATPVFSGVEYTGAFPFGVYTYAQFNSLTLQSSSPTLDLGQVNLQDVVVTGATTLDTGAEEYDGPYTPGLGDIVGGTLNISVLNVSDPYQGLPAGIALYGVDVTGGKGGKLDVSVSSNATLNLDSETLGSFSLSIDGGTLIYSEIDSATMKVAASSTSSTLNGATLGAGVTLDVAAGATLVQGFSDYNVTSDAVVKVSAGGTYYINNSGGSFINNGSIDVVKGVLVLDPGGLQNNGSISVTGGTLGLIGYLTLGSLSALSDPSSVLAIGGQLDLGGGSVTLGQGGVPYFVVQGGQVNDGTLTVDGGKPATWNGGAIINASLVNNTDITLTGASVLGYYSNNAAIYGDLSGSGTIGLEAANGTGETLTLGSTVTSGQTISFIGPDDTLTFLTTEAAYGFLGTLSGFAVGDSLVLEQVGAESANFVGDSIVIDSSTNVTLATDTALHGSLAITLSGYFQTITYVSTATSVRDWTAADVAGGDRGEPAHPEMHIGGGAGNPDALQQDWLLALHQF